jgi:hypothetical protein
VTLDPDNAVFESLCEFVDGLKDQCPEKCKRVDDARQGKDVRVKVLFLPKGAKKAKVAYSALPKAKAKKSTKK